MVYLVIVALMAVLCGGSEAIGLTFGLIPEQNVFEQVARHKPLEEYLSKKTGVYVKFTMLSRYGNIIEHFAQRKLDGAFWGSFTGAMAIKKLAVQPIARPLGLDGRSTYRGYIFVRKGSKINSVADMRGKTVAFVEKATTAGYVFPVAYFKGNGVHDIDAYFKEYFFTGSHDAAIRAVLNGDAAIGTAKNTVFELMARSDPRTEKDLIILARSPAVPSNGLGVRQSLDANMKKMLKEILLKMNQDAEGKEVLKHLGAAQFVPTVNEDYKPVFDIAAQAGIDIETYSYVNR